MATTITTTTRKASGSGPNPNAAEMRDAVQGMPDASWVSITHTQSQRGDTDGWEITVTYNGPLPPRQANMPLYPPGVRSVNPYQNDTDHH